MEAPSNNERQRISAMHKTDAVAALRGIIRIGEYINARTKTIWRCAKGHEWEAKPDNIKNGKGCPYCSGLAGAKERTDTAAATRGITRIGEYINSQTKTRWICASGHEWNATPSNIQRGKGCPHCSGKVGAIERIDTAAAARGITRIGDFITVDHKTRWRCTEGHEWEAKPDNIRSGKGCPHCSGRAGGMERADEAAGARGITRIGPYINSLTHTRWRCSEGHEWEAIPGSIVQGAGCPFCSGLAGAQDRTDEAAAARGITRIGKWVNSQTKTRWRCHESHEWEATPSHIANGTGCPHCAGVSCAMNRIDEVAATRGITRIGPYINSLTHTRWRCSEGHEWETTPTTIRTGSGCPHCSGKVGAIERIDTAAAARGITRIGDFITVDHKTRWRCAEGHEWEAKPDNVKSGQGCPFCAGKRDAKERADEAIAIRGITRIGEWVNTSTKTRWRCEEGHEWDALPGNVKGGQGCPHCADYGYSPSKPGSLYVLISECGGWVKIGITRNPAKRLEQLTRATPFLFSVLQLHHDENGAIAQNVERGAHKMLDDHNAGLTGFDGAREWFKATRSVMEFISLL